MIQQSNTVIRASFLHFINDPARVENIDDAYQYISDGLLIIENGKVKSLAPFNEKSVDLYPHLEDKRGQLIMPGFIDTHIHYPQTEMIAAYGEQLLEWLETYTFPTEKQFKDKLYAQKISQFFINELLKNGTTSALVFGTVHPESVDALFEEAEKIDMRMIAGKVMMDRNAPDDLLDTAQSSYDQSKALIEKWHNKGRLQYAITPRFAPTSTPEQLALAGKLKAEYPDVYVQTHLSENIDEIEWVKSLFPEREGYLDVYEHYGLTGDKSVFAHCIHLTDKEWETLANTKSVIAFCPTSNLFLGSGLFNLDKADDNNVPVGLATDVGGGTSFSQLRSLSAQSLSLDHKVGNFEKGKEADFIVLDWAATELQTLRLENSNSLQDKLFALMMLGDERNIHSTYVAGQLVYSATN